MAAVPYQAPQTKIGNPRTVDLCSGIKLHRFAKYGDVSPTVPVTPVDCWFLVTPPGAKADVRMSAYVYGLSRYIPPDSDLEPRTVSGQEVWFYPFEDHYCRAMIAADDVAIGIEADDTSDKLPESRVCAMRDTLLTQMAEAVTADRFAHRAYGSNSLTALDMCDHLNTGSFSFPDADGLELRETGYGNGCALFNSVYSLEIWIGLQPPPVMPGPHGRRLNLHGHDVIQQDPATATDCEITAQQDLVPGADYAETIEASVAVDSPRGGSSAEALCTDVAGAVLVQFLEATGRI